MCGIKTNNLSTYIDRGKVVLVGELIDTEHETNIYFVEKRREHSQKKNIPLPDTEEIKLNERVSEKKEKEVQAEFKFPAEHPPQQSRNSQLDQELKEQEKEKNAMQLEITRAKLEKIRGESIPTDLVKGVMLVHSKSITVAFKNAAEDLLTNISKIKNLSIVEISDLRGALVKSINEAVMESIDISKLSIKNIISEYSQQRDVGERS